MGDCFFGEDSLPLSCRGEEYLVSYVFICLSYDREELEGEVWGPLDYVWRQLLRYEAAEECVEEEVAVPGAGDSQLEEGTC